MNCTTVQPVDTLFSPFLSFPNKTTLDLDLEIVESSTTHATDSGTER